MNRRERSVDNPRDPPGNSRAKKSSSAEPFNSSLSSASSASRKKSKFAFWTNLSFWPKPAVQPVKAPSGGSNGASSFPSPPGDDNLEQDLGSSYESVNSIATTTSFAFVSPKKLPKGRRIPVDDEGGSSRTLPGQHRTREGCSGGTLARLGLKKKYGLQSCESLEHVESRGGTLQRRRARLQAAYGNYEIPSTSGGFASDTGTLTGTDTAQRKRKAPPVPLPVQKVSSIKVSAESTPQSPPQEETPSTSQTPVTEPRASPELSRPFLLPIPVASCSSSSSNNVELLKVTSLSGGSSSTKLGRVPSKRESYPGMLALHRKGRLNCACSTSIFASHSRRAKVPCGSDHCIHTKVVHVKGKKKAPPPPNPFGDPETPGQNASVQKKKVPRNPFYEDPEESTPPHIGEGAQSTTTVNPGETASAHENTTDVTQSSGSAEETSSSGEISSVAIATCVSLGNSPSSDSAEAGCNAVSISGHSELSEPVVDTPALSSSSQSEAKSTSVSMYKPFSNSNTKISNSGHTAYPHVTSLSVLATRSTKIQSNEIPRSGTISSSIDTTPSSAGQSCSSDVIYATIATAPSTGVSISSSVTTWTTTTTTAPVPVSSVTTNTTISSSSNSVIPVVSASTQLISTSSSTQPRISSSTSASSSRAAVSTSTAPSPSRLSSASIFTFISSVPGASASQEETTGTRTTVSPVTSDSTPVPATSSAVSPCSPGEPASISLPGLQPALSTTFSPEALALAEEIAQNLRNDEQERQLLQESSASASSPSTKTKSPRGSLFNFSRTPKKTSSTPSNSGDLESLLHSSQTLRAQVTAVDQQVRAHLVEESPPVSPGEGRAHKDKSPMFFFSTKSSRKSLPPSTIEEVPSPGGNSSAASTPPPFSNGGDSANSPVTTPIVTLRPWYKRLSGGSSSGASSRPKPSVILLPKFSDLDREATRIVEENKRRSAELAFNANARTLIDIFNETFEPLTPLSPPPAEELESESPRGIPDQQTNLSSPPATEVSTSSPSSSSSVVSKNVTTTSSVVSSPQNGLFASTTSPTPSSGAIPKTSVASTSPAPSSKGSGSPGKRSKESRSSISASSVPLSGLPLTSSVNSNNSIPMPKLITSGSSFTSTATATTTVTPSSSVTAISPASVILVSSSPSKSANGQKLTPTSSSPSHSSEEPRSIAVVQPQAKQPPASTKSASVVTTSPSLNSSVGVSLRQSTAVPTSTPTTSSVVVSSSRPSAATTTLSQATPSSPVSSTGEDWSCPRCTLKNTYWRALCEACYFRRDSGPSTTSSSSMSAILQQVNRNKTPPPPSVTTPACPPSTPAVTPPIAKPTQAVKPKTSSAPACENFLSQLPPKEIPGKHDADKNKLLQQNSSVGVRLVEDPEVEELSLERLRRARLAFFQKDQEQKASQLASSERKPPAGPSPGKRNNLTTPSNSNSTSCVPKHSINVFDDGEDSFLDNCTRLVTSSTFIGNIPPCHPGPSSSSPSPGGWRPLLAPITEADANLYCLSEWDRIYENWELPSDDSPQRPATVPGHLPTSDSHSPNFLASATTTNTLSEVEDESVLEMERTRKHRTHNSHNKSAGGGGAMGGGVGDLFAVEENERGVAALLRKLEWAIGTGEHRLAASLAHDLALLKVKVAALGPATPTDPITIRVYVEDRFMQQGPFLVQVWESMRVSELKAKIESDWGIPVHFQKWILGQQMAEGDITPLASFHLKNNSLAFLYLVTPNIHQKPPNVLPPPVPAKVPQIPATGFPKVGQTGGTSTGAPRDVHLQNGHGVSSDTFVKPSGTKSPSKVGQVSSPLNTSGSIKTTNSGASTQAPAVSLAPTVANGHEPSGSVKPANAVNVKAPPKAQEKSESSAETKQKQLNTNPAVQNGPRNEVIRKENTEIAVSTENKVSNPAKPQESIVKRDPVNSVASVKLSPKISRSKVEEKTGSVAGGSGQPPAAPAAQTQPPNILTTAQPPRTASPKRLASEEQSVHQGNLSGGPTKSVPLKESIPNITSTSVSLKKDDTSLERSDSNSSKEQKAPTVAESAGTAKELAAGAARGKSNSLQQKLAHLRQAAEQAFGKTFGTSSQPTASNSANDKVNAAASSTAPDVTVAPKPPTAKENDPRPKPRVKKVVQHPKQTFSVLQKEESSSSGGEEYSSKSNSSRSNVRGKVRIQNPVDGCCQTTLEFPKTKVPGVIRDAERKLTKSPEALKSSAASGEIGFSPAELEDIRMHIPSPVEQFESKPNSPEPHAPPTGSTLPVVITSKPPTPTPTTLKAEETISSSASPVLTSEPKPLITSTTPSPIPSTSEQLSKSPVSIDEKINLLESSQAAVKSEANNDQQLAAQEAPTTSFGVLTVPTTQPCTTEDNSLPIRAEIPSSASSPSTALSEPVVAAPTPVPAFKSHLPPVILRATKPPPGPAAHHSSSGLPGRPHFLTNRRVSQIEIPPQFKQATAVPSPTPTKKVLSGFPAYSGSKTSFNQSPKPFGSTYSKEPERKSLLQRKNSDSSIANLVLDQNEDLSSLGAAALPTPNQEKKESNVDTYMRMLEDLEKLDLIPSAEPFDCPVCFLPVGPGEGVTLRDCLHNFCRECLVGAVKYADISTVGCPFRDDSYSCSSTLQEREIKALVPPDVFEAYLARSVKLAERVMTNTFHCRTSDCPGWCIFEDDVNSFLCPVCKKRNCLTCQAIHEDMDCRQYQRQLAIAAETDEDAKSSRLMLETMIERGEALDCPACHVVLLKKWGCDWVRCSYCKTEICWVTKGFRWGPGGKGDNSGGCKCGVNGVRCHPKCTYCH